MRRLFLVLLLCASSARAAEKVPCSLWMAVPPSKASTIDAIASYELLSPDVEQLQAVSQRRAVLASFGTARPTAAQRDALRTIYFGEPRIALRYHARQLLDLWPVVAESQRADASTDTVATLKDYEAPSLARREYWEIVRSLPDYLEVRRRWWGIHRVTPLVPPDWTPAREPVGEAEELNDLAGYRARALRRLRFQFLSTPQRRALEFVANYDPSQRVRTIAQAHLDRWTDTVVARIRQWNPHLRVDD